MAEQLTTRKLAEEITADAGIDPKEIPHMVSFIDPRENVWKMGEPSPIRKDLVIFCMFMDGEDVLVYCAPTKEKDDKGEPVPYTRFTLSRHAGSLVGESMTLDTFKALASAELVNVFEETSKMLGGEEPEPEPAPGGNGAAAGASTPAAE